VIEAYVIQSARPARTAEPPVTLVGATAGATRAIAVLCGATPSGQAATIAYDASRLVTAKAKLAIVLCINEAPAGVQV